MLSDQRSCVVWPGVVQTTNQNEQPGLFEVGELKRDTPQLKTHAFDMAAAYVYARMGNMAGPSNSMLS